MPTSAPRDASGNELRKDDVVILPFRVTRAYQHESTKGHKVWLVDLQVTNGMSFIRLDEIDPGIVRRIEPKPLPAVVP